MRVCMILLLLAGAARAMAAESAAVQSPRLTATLVSDTDAVEAGRPFRIALRLRMAPGWHTYWQNPGDAGSAPEVSLTLPEGTVAGPIAWPAPHVLREGPITTYAYTGEVLLPMAVTPGAGAKAGAQTIEADANWLVCERICVPEEGRFTLDLPAGRPGPSAQAPLFEAQAARMPRPSPFAASFAPDGTLTLAGAGLSGASVKDAWFFPASWGLIDQGADQSSTVRDGSVAIALRPGEQLAKAGSLPGVVVLRDRSGQESVLQVDATPGGPAAGAAKADAAKTGGLPLGRTLVFAFLGGLLLNLMPCVFPVLAMKAMALARMSGQMRGEARSHAGLYTAGVLLAFAGLGGALLAARAAGEAAGWGFQFQSPVFVAAMAWLLFLVGLNLSGVYAVGGGLAGAGQGLVSRGGRLGSFGTGVLAALVATPCTAPFMGAAIAAALAAPASVTVLVFLAMGFGMALPFLLLGLFPGWARALPRPGAWMEVLRGALAFPMYAAAAWLIWVLSLQSGPQGVLAAVSGLVLLGFGAWVFGMTQRSAGSGRRVGQVLALASVAGAAALLGGIMTAPPASAGAGAGSGAGSGAGVGAGVAAEQGVEPYSAARLAALREEGRPVFVNMTAAWCVTCLVNERVALSPEAVRTAFGRRGVAYLKGDWTRGDKAVTAFLRSHERDGVPLYVLYPPGGGAPRVLPQILTEAEMLSQLDKLEPVPPGRNRL